MKKYHPTRFSEILAFLIDAPVLFLVYMIVAHGDPNQAFYRPIFLMCGKIKVMAEINHHFFVCP